MKPARRSTLARRKLQPQHAVAVDPDHVRARTGARSPRPTTPLLLQLICVSVKLPAMQKSTPIVSLDELLNTHAISEEELLRRSTKLERWLPADRTLALARARVRASGDGSYADASLSKPRTGRGLGRKHLRAARAGHAIPRVPRAKLDRALADALRHRGVAAGGGAPRDDARPGSEGAGAEARP